jgi:hypothetical protein
MSDMFNAIEYLEKIAKANSLAKKHEFIVGECSGIEGLEPLMQNYRKAANYIMVDDTVDGSMISNRVGWYNRRTYTVFIFAMYREDDMDDRRQKLDLCREIFRQLLSHLIADTEKYEYDLVYMRTQSIQYRELNSYNFSGVTGLYFMLNVDEPADLQFDASLWD